MSLDRRDWIDAIKRVERHYLIARFSLDRLATEAQQDSSISQNQFRVRQIGEAVKDLEATYIIRLFALIETRLRSYWKPTSGGKRPRMYHLLQQVVARRRIPNEEHQAAQVIREYRNSLVHEALQFEPIPLARSRGALCKFLGYLPETW